MSKQNGKPFSEGEAVIMWVQGSNSPLGRCRFETVGRVNRRWAYVAGHRFSQRTGLQVGSSFYMIEHVTEESREAARYARPLAL